MIEARRLTKRFSTRQGVVTAVDGVDFTVPPGQFVGYVGPNGAGKSTTVKMMCGILRPTSGTLLVDGLVPCDDRRRLARRMGVVFGQRSQLWWDLPLRDSFRLVRRLYGVESGDFDRRMRELTDVLALAPLLDVPVRSLSLGQRMRGELAAAVLPAPTVLFLDEPTIGLDVEAKAAVRTFLAELNRDTGTTVVLTTHDLGDIVQLCRRLLIIDHGRVIFDGSVEGLRQAFGVGRGIVVDLVKDGPVQVEGATVLRSEARRHWLQVRREQNVAEVVGRLLSNYEVEDLTVEEPDIEDIVRRIYREGVLNPPGR
ncbi:MAG: ATP-binding cassette domain-containing protein [Actinomycetota bacterium]|nr:ATP-binding cassette domain-containing protein [Actinomycetota bacterium]